MADELTCAGLIQGQVADCAALDKVGGVKPRVWVGQLSQLDEVTPYTEDGDGYIDAINFASASPAYGLHKFVSKKEKHNGNTELVVGENVNTFNQQANLVLYHSTPEHREAIEQLINAEDVFVIFQTQAGQLEVYGITQGLNASAGNGGTGVVLNDSTAFSLTLAGEQLGLPKLFLTGGSLAASITYLDSISA